MKKAPFLSAAIALLFLASVCITSVAAPIWVEDEDRDPASGYDPAPGESWSWVYQGAYLNPQTGKYSGHVQTHDYDWKNCTGYYNPHTPDDPHEDHPWAQTYVEWREDPEDEWMLDTFAEIAW